VFAGAQATHESVVDVAEPLLFLVRDLVHRVADAAGVFPFEIDGSRGDASDVTPHALRHSVAWRMKNAEDGNTLYDVRNRLRHRSIQTTGRIHDHINEV